jgi:hypothetical protein
MPFGYHNSAKITRGKYDGQRTRYSHRVGKRDGRYTTVVKARFQVVKESGSGRTWGKRRRNPLATVRVSDLK